jgi:hypothetical protein
MPASLGVDLAEHIGSSDRNDSPSHCLHCYWFGVYWLFHLGIYCFSTVIFFSLHMIPMRVSPSAFSP